MIAAAIGSPAVIGGPSLLGFPIAVAILGGVAASAGLVAWCVRKQLRWWGGILIGMGLWAALASLPIVYYKPLFNFFAAVRGGDVDETSECLRLHPDYLNASDMCLCSPLAVACGHGRSDMAQFLIDKGADVNGTHSLYPPLALAAANCQTQAGKVLLAHGADTEVCAFRHESTPLVIAAGIGCEDFVRMLIAHAADVEAMDEARVTPLIAAAKEGHSGVIRILLEAGIQRSIKPYPMSTSVLSESYSVAVRALTRCLP
jgi:hypothetical protein